MHKKQSYCQLFGSDGAKKASKPGTRITRGDSSQPEYACYLRGGTKPITGFHPTGQESRPPFDLFPDRPVVVIPESPVVVGVPDLAFMSYNKVRQISSHNAYDQDPNEYGYKPDLYHQAEAGVRSFEFDIHTGPGTHSGDG